MNNEYPVYVQLNTADGWAIRYSLFFIRFFPKFVLALYILHAVTIWLNNDCNKTVAIDG